jgi:enoyl-CoA hydratase
VTAAAEPAPHLLYSRQGAVAYLTMNRPEKRNALSPQMLVLMARAWREIRDDPEIRVAVLTGAGNRAFCSGADLGRLIPLVTRQREPDDEWDEQLLADRDAFADGLLRGFQLYKPVIAAVNGDALAGGTELVLASDLRVAANHATFGLTEVARGIIAGAGGVSRTPRQVPYCKAMEILLLGRPMPAAEAWRIGLVNELVEPGEVPVRASALAEVIAGNGPIAVQAVKEAVLRSNGATLEEALAIESEVGGKVFTSEDAIEGPRAFIEKRPPRFTGR